jgi:mono/diheme cytochrome c family protein
LESGPFAQQGYNFVFVPFESRYPSGRYEEFADGFKGTGVLLIPGSVTYRPTGLAVGPDGSLYIFEDNEGRVWKVEYTGELNANTSYVGSPIPRRKISGNASVFESFEYDQKGSELYNLYCIACHQVDGRGVSNMQPSLQESEHLKNDEDYTIRLIIQGSELIENRQYNNIMPNLSFLSDQEISAVINYSKTCFASSASSVTRDKVAAARASLSK